MTTAAPYVGLAPFGEADADKFFGRDAERKRIIANLRASRFTLLHARSGVGKSSLLRAGVVARLAAAPDSRLVPVIFSSWSGDPNVELPRALGGGDGLEDALERRTSSVDGTLLVILDQFEEFFQYHQGRPAGKRFADELARCVQRKDLRAHFLVSIREDAYSRLGDEFKGRLPNVYANYLHLDDLDERGARAAIEEPLKHTDGARSSIEPALVDQVLHDVRRDDATNGNGRYEAAHLQYVLRRLWEEEDKRGSQNLRLATLQSLGGSKAIFERHFDDAVAGLGNAEQDALAQAFRFLVTSRGTKRAEGVTELAEVTGVPQPTLTSAMEHLRQARILTPVAGDGDTRYELAHDLLAEAALDWRREREKANELRRLKRTISWLGLLAAVLAGLIVWALVERAGARRQADRAEAQALVARAVHQLSVDPERSVALARDAWQLAATPEAEDALRRALGASLVRDRLDVGTNWGGTLAADGRVIVSEGPDGAAVWRGMQARSPSVRLPGGAAVVSADGSTVAATTPRGVAVAPSDGSGRIVRVAGLQAPALNADGRLLAAVDRAHGVRVIDSRSGRTLARHRPAGLWTAALAFDPSGDGRIVASDCVGEQLRVWAWRDGRTRTLRGVQRGNGTRIPIGGESFCLLALSPDGQRAVQSHLVGSASLWDLAGGRRVGPDLAAGTAVRDVAWSEDGERFAVAAGKIATVRDRSGRAIASTPAQVDFLNSVAFDHDAGDMIVTSSRDGVARVWEVGAAGPLAELRGHTDDVGPAVFTADGHSVVTLSVDGSARSWRVVDGKVIRHRDWVLDAAFNPGGDRIATAAADGAARITPLGAGRPVPIRGYFRLQTANAIAFDPSGRRVVVAGGHDVNSGHVVIADATTGDIQQELLPAGQDILSATFSPDGRWVVTTAVGAPPGLWRLSDFGVAGDNQPTARLERPKGVEVIGAEFSPDGRSIVTAANDGVARVYDAQTRGEARRLESGGLLAGAIFSPDGGRILTYGSDSTARIWDVATGRRLVTLRGHASWISHGDFSPDGRRVVTGSVDQTTRVWDARTGRLLSIQRMHGDAVNSVEFGPDGRHILSASDDRTARVYPCATCAEIDDLVRLAAARLVVSPSGSRRGGPAGRSSGPR